MDPLVSVSWLAAHMHQPHFVVVDATLPPVGVVPAVDTHARYLAGHIPGAVFFDIDKLSDHDTPLPHMLPKPETFAHDMAGLGIGSAMTIVVYEQTGVFSAPRARWMLRTLGAEHVCLLDGGLTAWIEAGYPVEEGPVKRPAATFHASLNAAAVRDFEQLQELLKGKAPRQVLDARPAGRFNGSAPEPRPGLRSGHMPGSTNVPSQDLVDNGRLKSQDALRKIFAERHVDLTRPITTTCGSGVTAAIVALGLERCGVTDVSLYDGSWAEYAQHPNATIETGS